MRICGISSLKEPAQDQMLMLLQKRHGRGARCVDLDQLLPTEDSARPIDATLAIAANNIRSGDSDYRFSAWPVVGLSMARKVRGASVHRVHVARLAGFRRVNWKFFVPLVFVANVTVAAIVWYVVDLLIR
jgi:hypothetical protein